jgi:hypothetical protein
MKTLLFLLLVVPAHTLYAQKADCRVMIPALQGSYHGGCKNGLAHGKGTATGTDTYSGSFKNGFPHGKGTYTWARGNTYHGDWSMGMRDGVGTFTEIIDGRDSVMEGIWKEDHFVGPKPKAPKVIQQYNIVSTAFTCNGEGNNIAISFYQNGINNEIEWPEFVVNSGTEYRVGKIINFRDIEFPFHCRVTYLSWNSLKTFQYNCILEFEVTQPGSWDLRIGN